MLVHRVRQAAAKHWAWWCLAGIFLSALQPFLFTHFRQDGWEAEPGFRVRNASSMALFDQDERSDHAHELETTLYAPASAHTDLPDVFEQGLNLLMALVVLMHPLALARIRRPVPIDRELCERVAYAGGAPPLPTAWRIQPPKTAPPSHSI